MQVPVLPEYDPPPPPPPVSPEPNRVARRWDDDDSPIEKKKRKKRPSPSRRKPPVSLGPWILLGVLVLLAIAGAITAIVLIKYRSNAEAEQRKSESPTTTYDEPSRTDEPKKLNITYGPLPEGWSYNPPSFGFKAAWPVEPGADKFAPVDGYSIMYSGTKPNSWAIVKGSGEEQALVLGVTRIVLSEEMVIDGPQTLKNYLKRLQAAAGPNPTTQECTVDGKPGYEIRGQIMGSRFVQRATILDNVIWTVHIRTGLPANQTDEIANRFLNSFIPFPGE